MPDLERRKWRINYSAFWGLICMRMAENCVFQMKMIGMYIHRVMCVTEL